MTLLSSLERYEWSGPPELDPFTPHRRAISLGGMRVHEGAWTSVEVLKHLSLRYPLGHGEGLLSSETRYFLQLNSVRITLETSLVGMGASTLAIIWLDARYSREWVERSASRAIEELTLWRTAHDRMESKSSLEVIVWVEESALATERAELNRSVSQALIKIERLCQRLQVTLLSSLRGALSSPTIEDKEADQIWRSLRHELCSEKMLLRAEEESNRREITPFVDELVFIPRGQFYQGGGALSPKGERPRHRVKISRPFWASQTAVTKGLWNAVMEESETIEGMFSSLPMNEVTWFDALRFCNRLSRIGGLESAYMIEDHILPEVTLKTDANGFRLLSESEWEYACVGGLSTSLTTKSIPRPIAWTEQRSQLNIHSVAQLDPNGYGLYDCLGNVSEWCQDVYDPNAYSKRREHRLSSDPCEYAGDGGERVIRGGAFDSAEYTVTPSRREGCKPQQAWSTVGFRVARYVDVTV